MAQSERSSTTHPSLKDGGFFASPIHATCVSCDGRGILITGSSGSGKSALALQLIAHGASLVADDRVNLTQTDSGIVSDAPDEIAGMIEARGVGLLNAPFVRNVPVHLVVDMDKIEVDRLPQFRTCEIGAFKLPLVHKSDSAYFASALMLYLSEGRKA